MSGRRKLVAGAVIFLAVGSAVTAVLWTRVKKRQLQSLKPLLLKGAVIQHDPDTNKQLPIADVEITEANGLATGVCRSDSSGFFRLVLSKGIHLGQPVSLRFNHPGYQPLDLDEVAGDKIYVARMLPV